MIKSEFTKKEYNSEDVCRIINITQLAAYLDYGVELVDLYSSRNKEGKLILVGVVNKKDSYEAYDLWCKHELK